MCNKMSQPSDTLRKKLVEKLNGEMEATEEFDGLRFMPTLATDSDGFWAVLKQLKHGWV